MRDQTRHHVGFTSSPIRNTFELIVHSSRSKKKHVEVKNVVSLGTQVVRGKRKLSRFPQCKVLSG
jgi:hypothetical protein